MRINRKDRGREDEDVQKERQYRPKARKQVKPFLRTIKSIADVEDLAA